MTIQEDEIFRTYLIDAAHKYRLQARLSNLATTSQSFTDKANAVDLVLAKYDKIQREHHT